MSDHDSVPSLRELEEKLSSAAGLLDEAARLIASLGFDPSRNVRAIGEALSGISEIRHAIYRQDPSLEPPYLRR
jgi:DNA-directed RNA polymerase specialized sigma subunit